MFKPATCTRSLLAGVGILGQIPSLSFNVVLSQAEQCNIARSLVTLSRTLTQRNLDAFINCKRTIIPKVLALNGKAGWLSTITTSSHNQATSVLWQPAALSCSRPPDQNTVFPSCPHKLCDKVEPSTCKDFQLKNLDAKHKCFHCHRSSSIRNWSCPCGVRWHSCALHSHVIGDTVILPQTQVSAKWQASSSASRQRKRARSSSNVYEELFTEDLERERKRKRKATSRMITLGDSFSTPQVPVRLGLRLRRRLGI